MTQSPAPSRAQQLLQKLRAASQAGQPTLQSSQASGSAQVSDAEKLDIFEETLSSVETSQPQLTESTADQTADALAAQAMPQYAEELYHEVQPPQGGARGERIHVGAGMDSAAIEAATGMQAVEYEPQPEISPEVQEYMQSVEEHQETLPQEIVIADGHHAPTNTHVPKQPVIVLPVDESIEQKARFKSPNHAIAWLWRWTRKISKMFPNKVVYKFVEEPQQ